MSDEETKVPAEVLSDFYRTVWKGMAEAMYIAYGDSVGWKAVSGHPMPTFDKVGRRVEGAWCVAAEKAYSYACDASRPDLASRDPLQARLTLLRKE